MKTSTFTVRIALVFLLSPSHLVFGEPLNLYVISGTPGEEQSAHVERDAQVPTGIYRIGADGSVALARSFSARGIESVSLQHDSRLFVVSTPAVTPERLLVVSMDRPQIIARTVGLTSGSGESLIEQHFFLAQNRTYFFATVFAGDSRSRLSGFNLSIGPSNTLDVTDTAVPAVSNIEVFGTSGANQTWSDAVQVRVQPDGKVVAVVGLNTIVGVDVLAPVELRTQNNSLTFLNANSSYLAMLTDSAYVLPKPEGLGTRIDFIYNRDQKSWSKITVPGSGSWARASGTWLLYVVAELAQSGPYLPGKLFGYDSATGQSFLLDTGQRDSEALIVHGNTLIFRVNNSLYEAPIGTESASGLKPLASDAVLGHAHWAFFSPSP
jgi:hypothetical protein